MRIKFRKSDIVDLLVCIPLGIIVGLQIVDMCEKATSISDKLKKMIGE